MLVVVRGRNVRSFPDCFDEFGMEHLRDDFGWKMGKKGEGCDIVNEPGILLPYSFNFQSERFYPSESRELSIKMGRKDSWMKIRKNPDILDLIIREGGLLPASYGNRFYIMEEPDEEYVVERFNGFEYLAQPHKKWMETVDLFKIRNNENYIFDEGRSL